MVCHEKLWDANLFALMRKHDEEEKCVGFESYSVIVPSPSKFRAKRIEAKKRRLVLFGNKSEC